MAQQTQIKTMLPYFERWMQRFPDFKSLAKAESDDVLKHWEGLGYYSRARNLHKLAKEYISLKNKPNTSEEWQTLPGIGPYTSAAISSIAFNYPAAVVDGNVIRILARLTNNESDFKSNDDAAKTLTPLARQLLHQKNPGDHNQAMMELGATVCKKNKPLCTLCPVLQFCASAINGAPETLPKIRRKSIRQVQINRLWVFIDKKLLLYRIPLEAKQLAGQYELPSTEQLGITPPKTKPIAIKTRSITHQRIKERIHSLKKIPRSLGKNLHWIDLSQIDKITLSGPHRRWIQELIQQL